MLRALQNKGQIAQSRKMMVEQGRSCVYAENRLRRVMRRLSFQRRLPVGDVLKSWDVALTLQFIQENLPKDARTLDLGAYCSEVPVSLANMGFTGVHGVDLNSDVLNMPNADVVEYRIGDFMETTLESGSFDAITAISVIEHGYEPHRLFAELGRLLKPGGYFIASFDFWPEKIDTKQTRFFDMSWLIFSEQDVTDMLKVAESHGMQPVGDLDWTVDKPPIECMGFDYTFGWVVLRRA